MIEPRPGTTVPEQDGRVFIARQPIFTAKRRLHAYELLYRARDTASFDGLDGTRATEHVIANSLTSIGLEKLAANRPVFLNFNRELLLSSLPFLLPVRSVVIEVLESVELDDTVIARCRELREAGYELALDDVFEASRIGPLAGVIHYVKVDLPGAGRDETARIARACAHLPLKLLAEKVETQEDFSYTRRLGYSLFQGYYFERPEVVSARSFEPMKTSFVRMQRELTHEDLDYPKIEETLRADPALTHRLLRYLNSASFHIAGSVQSVRQAIVLLGETELRRWLFLMGLTKLAGPEGSNPIRHALLRARFCERLAPRAGLAPRAPEFFLMGLLSVFGALFGATMNDTVAGIGLSADVEAVLLNGGGGSRLASVFALALAYERGAWETVQRLVSLLGLSDEDLSRCYEEATAWTEQAFSSLCA